MVGASVRALTDRRRSNCDLDLQEQPDREQRMAAEIEEIVGHADVAESEQLLPDRDEPLFRSACAAAPCAAGGNACRVPLGRPAARACRPFRSGVSGSAGNCTNADGTMCTGSRSRQNARSSSTRTTVAFLATT
jgi:hypothetical protein